MVAEIAEIAPLMKSLIYALAIGTSYQIISQGITRAANRIVQKPAPSEKKIAPASGLDPYDKRWMGDEPWSKVWDFTSEDELYDFGNVSVGSAYVENSTLKFRLGFGMETKTMRRVYGKRVERYAVCFRLKTYSTRGNHILFYLIKQHNATNYYGISVPYTRKIGMYQSGYPTKTWDNRETWQVVMYDFANNVMRVYGEEGGVIFEYSVVPRPTDDFYEIGIFGRWNSSSAIYELEIDWIAVRHHTFNPWGYSEDISRHSDDWSFEISD